MRISSREEEGTPSRELTGACWVFEDVLEVFGRKRDPHGDHQHRQRRREVPASAEAKKRPKRQSRTARN
jgi:hypothetical protein